MASSFKTALGKIGTGPTTIYVAPADVTSIVVGLVVANTLAATITVSVFVTDTTNTIFYLIKNATVIEGSSIVVVGGDCKIGITPGMKVSVQTNTASSADVAMTYLET